MASPRARPPRSDRDRAAGASERTIALNRRARHDYVILAAFEAGLVLTGSEVKSIRSGAVSLAEGYVTVEGGEAYLLGVHVALYKPAAHRNHDPTRARKLLLHRDEIIGLDQHLRAKGQTAVPLRVFGRGGRIKLEIGLARGRKKYDNREKIEARDAAREIARHTR
ncbi:MAG: SsrA-binding protein SmpB [Actinobacteria bacterium]|nr:SsrA-binding protein SmpB [Actinomycetota bacterium]